MKPETYRNLNIISLIINLFIMAILVYTVLPNIDKAEHDPLNYGARVYDIRECKCLTNDNKEFFYNETAIWIINNNPKKQELTFNETLIKQLINNS